MFRLLAAGSTDHLEKEITCSSLLRMADIDSSAQASQMMLTAWVPTCKLRLLDALLGLDRLT